MWLIKGDYVCGLNCAIECRHEGATLDDLKLALAMYGLVAIPEEPTEDMLEYVGAMDGWNGVFHEADENHIAWYRAMIKAAQVLWDQDTSPIPKSLLLRMEALKDKAENK